MELAREFRQVGKPPELLDALAKIWGQDKLVEQRLRRWRLATIISLIAIFPGFFLFVVPGVLSIVSAAVCGWQWLHYHRLNLEDRRILTPLKFLEVIQADILPRDPVRLRVSFEDFRKHGRKLEESGGRLSSVRRSKYEDTWLEIEGWLAEKTRFQVAVSQRVSLSEKSKRKYTKRKLRIREEVSLALRPNPKLYAALERLPQLISSGEEVAGLRVSSVRVSGRHVLLEAQGGLYTKLSGRSSAESGADALINGNKLLTLMAAVYDRLGQCRAQAAAG